MIHLCERVESESQGTKHTQVKSIQAVSVFLGFYRQPTKFWQGNVFTHIHQSVHRRAQQIPQIHLCRRGGDLCSKRSLSSGGSLSKGRCPWQMADTPWVGNLWQTYPLGRPLTRQTPPPGQTPNRDPGEGFIFAPLYILFVQTRKWFRFKINSELIQFFLFTWNASHKKWIRFHVRFLFMEIEL